MRSLRQSAFDLLEVTEEADEPQISIIVPTLNEEEKIRLLLESLTKQREVCFETIVVDGGSTDKTVAIAEDYRAKALLEKGLLEFPSRNIGAKIARGEILLFTCADVTFPADLLMKIKENFEDDGLIALTGPDFPVDSVVARVEYGFYNFVRFVFSSFPKPYQRFSTSTNFLAVRKSSFEKTGGFISDINGDGIMGKCLSELGKVRFSMKLPVFVSSRRFSKMGFANFNLHYLYVLENFFPFLSNSAFLKRFKIKSGAVHRRMHE